MIRRQARLRREYLYRKSLEERHRATQQRKERARSALEEGRPLGPDLRRDGLQLVHDADWDDPGPRLAAAGGEGPADGAEGAGSRDDEYRWAGVHEPKIVITTSRSPSVRLKKFAKELKLVLPNSQRMNRGGYDVQQLLSACRANDVTDFIKISEHRGEPAGLVICHLPYGPTARFTLLDVGMRHDIPQVGTMSEQYPHLVFHNLTTPLGARVTSMLRFLFPVPKPDSRRVMSFVNQDDFILFRHHVYQRSPKANGAPHSESVQLTEVGPRFTLRLFELRLGTPDQSAGGQVEWVLRPYMNTARKRRFLSDQDAWLPAEVDDDERREREQDDRVAEQKKRTKLRAISKSY